MVFVDIISLYHGIDDFFIQVLTVFRPIFYDLKTPENFCFSGIFRGHKMKTCVRNWLVFSVFLKSLMLSLRYSGEPISDQCSDFIPPESTRKPKVFWCFQGV